MGMRVFMGRDYLPDSTRWHAIPSFAESAVQDCRNAGLEAPMWELSMFLWAATYLGLRTGLLPNPTGSFGR